MSFRVRHREIDIEVTFVVNSLIFASLCSGFSSLSPPPIPRWRSHEGLDNKMKTTSVSNPLLWIVLLKYRNDIRVIFNGSWFYSNLFMLLLKDLSQPSYLFTSICVSVNTQLSQMSQFQRSYLSTCPQYSSELIFLSASWFTKKLTFLFTRNITSRYSNLSR